MAGPNRSGTELRAERGARRKWFRVSGFWFLVSGFRELSTGVEG